MGKKMSPIKYAEKYIDKDNSDKIDIVGNSLFRSGYTVEEIASAYKLSVTDTLRSMTKLDVEDIESLLFSNWMPYVIADLHSKVDQTKFTREFNDIENAWTELITKHTNV